MNISVLDWLNMSFHFHSIWIEQHSNYFRLQQFNLNLKKNVTENAIIVQNKLVRKKSTFQYATSAMLWILIRQFLLKILVLMLIILILMRMLCHLTADLSDVDAYSRMCLHHLFPTLEICNFLYEYRCN